MTVALLVALAKFGLAFIPLNLVAVMIFLERKGASFIQDRPGPNRAALRLPGLPPLRLFGFVHNFTDVVKLMWKEGFAPAAAHPLFYRLGPAIPVVAAILTPAFIPWFAPIVIEGQTLTGAVVETDLGLLALFAVGGLSVYGVLLGAWGSASKFPLLGGVRAVAVMLSYEVTLGLACLGMVVIGGGFDLTGIVAWQEAHTWGVVVQPVAFVLVLFCVFAETGRNPCDVVEGESELVGGFHTEYSSVRFALYFMGEYAHIVVASALVSTLFLGGWSLLPLPGFGTGFVRAHLAALLTAGCVVGAAACLGLLQVVQRWQRRHLALAPADAEERRSEYRFYRLLLLAVAGGLIIASPAVWWFVHDCDEASALAQILAAVAQSVVVVGKTLVLCWFFVWVRWTLPRLRVDQVLRLGWTAVLGLAVANLVVTAIIAQAVRGGQP